MYELNSISKKQTQLVAGKLRVAPLSTTKLHDMAPPMEIGFIESLEKLRPYQSASDGYRFTTNTELSNHLDAIFEYNKVVEAKKKGVTNRGWLIPPEEWVHIWKQIQFITNLHYFGGELIQIYQNKVNECHFIY